ncbi:MAG: ATP-dependent DNA helicase RecQ [Nanoarchaeota archaeon]|nr:ATP-dependent DNA helicase RecQ [Nanoarchaeota archaeon]
MEDLLKQYFGYDKFRPMQLDIIKNTLEKKDSLVIMPTGGGKSICYQLPTLKFEGLTLVISPLISLMKDQVDGLKINGINAEYINSSISQADIIDIQKRIQKKEVKLLYIAPERLALEDFRIFLSGLNVSLIAIDEAHCISEWGHDFRPDYRNLKTLRTLFSESPIIALTATATEKVRIDILKQLSLRDPKIFIASFDRENLNLMVVKKDKSMEKIIKMLEDYKEESIIIYCFSRKDSENIAETLRYNGFNALPYHAGLDPEIRKHNQELFIKDKVDIIVATIAFGMGINKPNVRLIIHHTFPKTLEGYYQEIGRAGRDGLPSDCVLFYSRGDKRKHEFFIDKISDEINRNNARTKLNQVMAYCEDNSCRRKHILRYFGEEFLKDNCDACDSCLKLSIPERIEQKTLISKETEKLLKYDIILFEKLRVLRKQIANQRNVPPFIIFGDVSLREMARSLPKNNKEFLNIRGVGQQKLKDFGDLFLEIIKNYMKEKGTDISNNFIDHDREESEEGNNSETDYNQRLKKIKENYANAYELWKQEDDERLKILNSENKTISEIAQILMRQPSAIRSRLRKFGLTNLIL